jgi:hypothetical protein
MGHKRSCHLAIGRDGECAAPNEIEIARCPRWAAMSFSGNELARSTAFNTVRLWE